MKNTITLKDSNPEIVEKILRPTVSIMNKIMGETAFNSPIVEKGFSLWDTIDNLDEVVKFNNFLVEEIKNTINEEHKFILKGKHFVFRYLIGSLFPNVGKGNFKQLEFDLGLATTKLLKDISVKSFTHSELIELGTMTLEGNKDFLSFNEKVIISFHRDEISTSDYISHSLNILSIDSTGLEGDKINSFKIMKHRNPTLSKQYKDVK